MLMNVAMLAPIAWRTPPHHYGPWEAVVSLLTEGLVERGVDVTLFATRDSITRANLVGVAPRGYEEDAQLLPKVWECLHISELFERGEDFHLIHNHFDFLPLTYMGMTSTPVVTTIHGFSSPRILPVYRKYNGRAFYVAISEADKSPELDYAATIHHGIDLSRFTFRPRPGSYLLFFGRIHHDKGAAECIDIARKTGLPLILAGIVQDREYFEQRVRPHLDGEQITYVGSVGPEKRDELLGGAYALLHPINFDEPFGLSVIEAMACGTPVLAVNRGSMPEVVAHGTTGYLVADAGEMAEVVPRVSRLDRGACRRWVEERFSADRMVEAYLRLYEQVLAGGSQKRQGRGGESRERLTKPALLRLERPWQLPEP
jgi:glycosyltransferase involved in cell wall biosynthesis